MRFDLMEPYWGMFQSGLAATLGFTALSLVVAFAAGAVVAAAKLTPWRGVRAICALYTSVFRGVPLMVLLFLVYYGTPQLAGVRLTPLVAGVVTFGLNGAATISEVLRGGIEGVDRGQFDAARAQGFGYLTTMRCIIVPQAMRSIAPALVNEATTLLKSSALVSTIGVTDILRTATTVQSLTYVAFEPLLIAAAMYYALVLALTALAHRLERLI